MNTILHGFRTVLLLGVMSCGLACAQDAADRKITFLLNLPGEVPDFEESEILSSVGTKGDEKRIYSVFRFKGSLEEFEKRLQKNQLKMLVVSQRENPLWDNCVNHMDATPRWFERAKGISEKSFDFNWVPFFKLGEKSFDNLASLEIRVDAYKEADGKYQFLGACVVGPGAMVGSTDGSAAQVEVARDSFGVKSLLAEKLLESEEDEKASKAEEEAGKDK